MKTFKYTSAIVLGIIAFFLLVSECEQLDWLIWSKCLGFGMAYIACLIWGFDPFPTKRNNHEHGIRR